MAPHDSPASRAPADVAEDLGVHRELERAHGADRCGSRRPGLGVQDYAGGSLAGGRLRLGC
jgi:hypothetical protein